LQKERKVAHFEQSALPHLGAAYNLARWLLRNPADAEDVVQESYLRAFRFFGGYQGGDGRAWLLKIVRNTAYTWLQHNRSRELAEPFNDEIEEIEDHAFNPETLVIQAAGIAALRKALDELPIEFREVMVLRELEGFSYKEISAIVEIPIGTVMSRLARARKRLQEQLTDFSKEGVSN